MEQSQALFDRAKKVLPGGVNSPVRAYRAVGRTAQIHRKSRWSLHLGCGRQTLYRLCVLLGTHDLGAQPSRDPGSGEQGGGRRTLLRRPTRRKVEIAELMTEMVPQYRDGAHGQFRDGSGDVGPARLARGATGRDKIIKFEGCYHGHSDCMLVKAGSSAIAGGCPDSAGVPEGTAKDTLTAQYNDLNSVSRLFQENPDRIACVIVEPVAANMGVVGPDPGFLEGLRTLCDQNGALLIFDEVITGFRLAKGGAQDYFGVRADLVTFGKIIGGGMPVGAYAGSRELWNDRTPPAEMCIRRGRWRAIPWPWRRGLHSFAI